MTVWTWTFLLTNLLYWAIFVYLVSRRGWDLPALVVGILHMLLVAVLSIAPFRSFVEPDHAAYQQIGLIHLEGRWVTLATSLLLGWLLAAAWITVAKGNGRWMAVVAGFDFQWALNFGGAILLPPLMGSADYQTIRLGEDQPPMFVGMTAQLILFLFFVVPFVVSGIWAVFRIWALARTAPLK